MECVANEDLETIENTVPLWFWAKKSCTRYFNDGKLFKIFKLIQTAKNNRKIHSVEYHAHNIYRLFTGTYKRLLYQIAYMSDSCYIMYLVVE